MKKLVCRTTIGMNIKKINEPTKTNRKIMKKTMKYLSMAALALVGAVMTGCSNEDIANNEQPAKQDNIVTVTTTIGLEGDDAATRALAIDYDAKTLTKTFAEGDQVALVYKVGETTWKKAVSTAANISADGKSASFTFTLTNPVENSAVEYYYPASMVNEEGSRLNSNLETQNGTLADVASKDLACASGSLTGTTLSAASVTLENDLAVVAFTLKDATGANDITSTITGMTIKVATDANIYNITRAAAAGPIYVAMIPTGGDEIDITATTSDGKTYTKSLASKTYVKSNFYQQGLRMTKITDLATLTGNYEAQDGDVLTGTLSGNYKITIAAGATVTLKDATINGVNTGIYNWAGLTPLGDATIILEGTNSIKGFYYDYPGIFAAVGHTLTINGTGSLTARSNGFGAGIGGGFNISCGNINISGGTITATGGDYAAGIGGDYNIDCGNINISGGTITATGGETAAGIGGGNAGTCGDINISGGTITATGGENAAGIGGGYLGTCGNINIYKTVTSVTAIKGENASSIGAGCDGSCGTVTIETDANVEQI